MASKKKHMERSHRSYHNPKPFASFERNDAFKASTKDYKPTLLDRVENLFHRTKKK